jgi:hypothetical protein
VIRIKKNKVQIKKPTVLFMTKEEQMGMAGRDAMASQYEYTARIIRNDMDEYFNTVVKKRLNIIGKPTRYNIDEGTIQLVEMPEIKVEKEVEKDGKTTK